jgi:hypothetical protein
MTLHCPVGCLNEPPLHQLPSRAIDRQGSMSRGARGSGPDALRQSTEKRRRALQTGSDPDRDPSRHRPCRPSFPQVFRLGFRNRARVHFPTLALSWTQGEATETILKQGGHATTRDFDTSPCPLTRRADFDIALHRLLEKFLSQRKKNFVS